MRQNLEEQKEAAHQSLLTSIKQRFLRFCFRTCCGCQDRITSERVWCSSRNWPRNGRGRLYHCLKCFPTKESVYQHRYAEAVDKYYSALVEARRVRSAFQT